MTSSLENADRKSANRPLCCLFKILDRKLGILNRRLRGLKFIGFMSNDQIWSMSCSMISIRKQIHKLIRRDESLWMRSFRRIRIRISDLWRFFRANPFSDQ